MEETVKVLKEKLERIENYIDKRNDIPIEILINIKNIIHSNGSDKEWKKKIIYYYNRKYPEYDIEKVPVNYEQFIVNKYDKFLDGIYVNYDISTMQKCDTEHFISLCSPYEDKEVYIHENTLRNELAFSYDKELLNNWRNDDIERTIYFLEKRLAKLKGSDKEWVKKKEMVW